MANINCEDSNINYKIRVEKQCTISNKDPKKNNKPDNTLAYALSSGQTVNKSKLSKTQYEILEALASANDCDTDDDIDILTLRDLMHAKERFKTPTDVFRDLGVKELRCDSKAGIVNITANNGEVLRIEFGKSNKTAKPTQKTSDKYEGIPQKWIPHIKNLSKTTGYSEELIMNIVLYEGFTPVAKYKNENGGLYEVGFGHTTQANHNNNFGKNFKIDIETAFKWLGQDIKDKEAKIKKFGEYYNYDKLPKSLQEAFIDVAFNRGEGRLNPKSSKFDSNYRSVHKNIEQGYLGSAAVRLRQEKFYIHEAGLRKRNVQRFLKTMKELPAKQIVSSMDLFNREHYYTKTLNMLKPTEADTLRREWNQIYYFAKNEIS